MVYGLWKVWFVRIWFTAMRQTYTFQPVNREERKKRTGIVKTWGIHVPVKMSLNTETTTIALTRWPGRDEVLTRSQSSRKSVIWKMTNLNYIPLCACFETGMWISWMRMAQATILFIAVNLLNWSVMRNKMAANPVLTFCLFVSTMWWQSYSSFKCSK